MDLLHDSHIWLLFSFIIFVGSAFHFGKGAILKMLDGRIETIRNDIKTAETLRIEAQELLAQYQRKQRDALSDAEKIINDAKINAEENRTQVEAHMKETLERRESQLKDRIARMEQNAIQEIQAYAADLAMNAATTIITEKLDKKTGEKLLEQSIQDVAKYVH